MGKGQKNAGFKLFTAVVTNTCRLFSVQLNRRVSTLTLERNEDAVIVENGGQIPTSGTLITAKMTLSILCNALIWLFNTESN